ncbi:MAG: ATP-binding cassette domain-containing protein, partial [Actinomycetota bacterium]
MAAEPSGSAATRLRRSGVAAIRLDGITKTYGAVTACRDVELELHAGRIHGVLGENGAGKSTLMKIMIGLVLPEEG